MFDLLLELLPLRDLRLELLREVGRLLDVPDRIESAGAEVRELPVQRRAHRLEFRAQAVDLEAFRPQIPELVVRDLVRRSPGLRAAGDCRHANPFLEGVILAREPLAECIVPGVGAGRLRAHPCIQAPLGFALEPRAEAFVLRLCA